MRPNKLDYFPCGVLIEGRVGEGDLVEVRFQDARGRAEWTPADAPVYLDRQSPGKRYLWVPEDPLSGEADGKARLFVIGDLFPPEFSDETVLPYSKDWNYIDLEYFADGLEWETVQMGEHVCHRLICNGQFGEWAYMHRPALLKPEGSEIAHLILPEGHCGNAPPRMLMEVLSTQHGYACGPQESLTGFLYLASIGKEGTGMTTAVAELQLINGTISFIRLLYGGSSGYTRFPDVGESMVFIHLWGGPGDEDPNWPCVHKFYDSESGRFEDFSDLKKLERAVAEEFIDVDRVIAEFLEPKETVWIY